MVVRRRPRIALLIVFFTIHLTARSQIEPDSSTARPSFSQDEWHASFSPYLWMAGLNGNVALLGHEVAVDQSFGDILGNLKFGFMGLTEVRRGSFGVLTDLLYIRLGDEGAVAVEQLPAAVNLKASANTFLLSPVVAYRVYADRVFAADALAGVRYYHLYASINGSVPGVGGETYSGTNNWADAVGGARFQLRLTHKAEAFFIGDAGGGGSSPTWQIVTGVGYQVAKRTALQVGYRHLYFNRQDGSSFGLDTTMEGFLVGATIRLK